jgi:hypothetical protein
VTLGLDGAGTVDDACAKTTPENANAISAAAIFRFMMSSFQLNKFEQQLSTEQRRKCTPARYSLDATNQTTAVLTLS